MDLKKKHRITYNSEKEDAFLVHMVDKIVKFDCNPEGLYHYEVPKKYIEDIAKNTSLLISTVSKNQMGYMQRQFERAKAAQELYHNVGMPTIENFKFF